MEANEPTAPARRFRYESRPSWLVETEPEPGDLSGRWPQILALVADESNESGLFSERSPEWSRRSGLGFLDTRSLVSRLLEAGALRRSYGRLYVVGWRETYRDPE